VAANVYVPSGFPRHHRSASQDRAEALMVVLVTIAWVVVCGWIAVWLLSDVGATWLGAVAGLLVAMPSEDPNLHPAVASTACSLSDRTPTSSRFSALAHPVDMFAPAASSVRSRPMRICRISPGRANVARIGVSVAQVRTLAACRF
jgi:hypothetical protein